MCVSSVVECGLFFKSRSKFVLDVTFCSSGAHTIQVILSGLSMRLLSLSMCVFVVDMIIICMFWLHSSGMVMLW